MTLGLAILMITIALLATGLFIFWIEPLSALPFLERLTPNIVYRVRTRLPLVALSFDDGPHPEFTPQVLDILQRFGAKATFFLIGDRASRHPGVVAAIRAAGHEIGNHYSSNVSTLAHSDAAFVRNLEQTEATLGLSGPSDPRAVVVADLQVGPGASSFDSKGVHATFGEGSLPQSLSTLKLFRPPGGVAWPRQIQLARQRGYTCVLGCAYPHDPMHPPVSYIRWLVEKNLVPGAIVILHDGISDPSRSLQALPHILEAARRKGLRVVSISELFRTASP